MMPIAVCIGLVASCKPWVAGEGRQQVVRWQFPPVDLAGLQCRRRGRGVGNGDPLDAVEMHLLRPGEEARPALPRRHITGKPLIGAATAGHMFFRQKAERAASDHLGDLLERVGAPPAVPA